MEKMGKNAEKIMYALVGGTMRQYTGKELSSLTALPPNEVNTAVRELERMGAVDLHIRASSEPYLFSSVALTAKGRVIFQETKMPGCDT